MKDYSHLHTKKDDFINHVNKLRLKNKSGWYQYSDIVEGKYIVLKGYNTWLQFFKVDNIDYSNNMDRSVKQFKNDLLDPFK